MTRYYLDFRHDSTHPDLPAQRFNLTISAPSIFAATQAGQRIEEAYPDWLLSSVYKVKGATA